MMTSTPVASSNARMFRPSRPMMRPFISSFGSDDRRHASISAVCSAAMRWMASATIFFASRSALRRAVSRISRSWLAASACASSSRRRISSALASWADMPASCSSRRRSSRDQLLELRLRARTTAFSRRPKSLARRADLLLALLEDLELAVEIAVAFLDTPLAALDLVAPLPRLRLPALAKLDRLFLSRDDRCLPERFGFASRFVDEPAGRLPPPWCERRLARRALLACRPSDRRKKTPRRR